jgi:phage terminase Nu1 subunit (DNA packaging protein)
MDIEITGHAEVTGDCGHKLQIPIGRLEDEVECPVCGAHDRLTKEQADGIRAQAYAKAKVAGTEHVRKELDQMLRGIASRSKNVTYKPGRK